jgi:hypothetical protein
MEFRPCGKDLENLLFEKSKSLYFIKGKGGRDKYQFFSSLKHAMLQKDSLDTFNDNIAKIFKVFILPH